MDILAPRTAFECSPFMLSRLVPIVPFLEEVRDDGLKNFLTVVTLRVFSLVFFSSNLEKGPSEDWDWDWAEGGVDWAWAWAWAGAP